MPGAEIAQYGIGFFAVAGFVYLATQLFQFLRHRNNVSLAPVIENNTRALENNTKAIEQLMISMTRQEVKLDELLARARRE